MSRPTESTRLRSIPSVDRLLRTDEAITLRHALGVERTTSLARQVTDELRAEVRHDPTGQLSSEGSGQDLLVRAVRKLQEAAERQKLSRIRRVINATGVILHTNLGRAPLSEAACKAVVVEAAGYCTLEYNAGTGTRGRRGQSVEKLLTQVTGAEDALVVNNCAAAALLILKVLASDGETIISRGELVEIGGDFRIPDVMANSGTRMIEVGSTNRTRLDDYRRAITKETRLLMRVHPSNYRIVGFTTSPTLTDLAECARENNILLYEDGGSGALFDLSDYDLGDEPIIKERIAQGADVVSFSGDKLLGSAQAGLIVGRHDLIERLRKHSLYRALRADKLCLAALEATLEAHLRGTSFSEVPALKMLALSSSDIEERAKTLLARLDLGTSPLRAELIDGQSAIGGGSGPNAHPATVLVALTHEQLSADAIEERLRSFQPGIIARVANEKVLLDLRTVLPSDEPELIAGLSALGRVDA